LLDQALHENSPRWTRQATPLNTVLIHGGVLALWAALFAQAFYGKGICCWSVGIAYIVYDTLLLAFTFWQTFLLRRPFAPARVAGPRPTLGVVIAAYNEAAVLAATIQAVRQQTEPPEEILIADDGSTDATAEVLRVQYGLHSSALGTVSRPAAGLPGLRLLRVTHGGKARALNQAMAHLTTELMLTVDADTILEPDAISAMRDAFAANPGLVAATGILTPVCDNSFGGRFFEWFQTYEYIRNFLSRYAWARLDSLLLISGAFAGFRRDAVVEVGGFDPDCMVEDYELIHRLRRYGYDHDLGWHSAVLGTARGKTSAPATVLSFLRQRRRWFGGFLQTQFWYRNMVGARKYQALGKWMLPVKAVDTLQPIYGLCAFALLIWYICTGRFLFLIPVGGIILAKIFIDLAFHAWSVRLYRNWTGGATRAKLFYAILAALTEPFGFQLLRHFGAAWGWVFFLTGRRSWGTQKRAVPKPI
jgi:cellulose synthase/poly-beta-1,6-N-acetylglucosamine synthase-like glycosyltransferase